MFIKLRIFLFYCRVKSQKSSLPKDPTIRPYACESTETEVVVKTEVRRLIFGSFNREMVIIVKPFYKYKFCNGQRSTILGLMFIDTDLFKKYVTRFC